MKATELRQKTPEELHKELLATRRSLLSLRVQAATQQLRNTSQFPKVRRDIARIKTVMHQKACAK
jgi:large subunit ribosomal protein L29